MDIDYDYKALGLRVGIEIHQQLDSRQKLFCRCANRMEGTRAPDYTLIRSHRPVLGETGKFDDAMLVEFKKGMQVVYEGFYNSTCTYEIDETPPFNPNEECIDIALEIALKFKMHIVRELHVSRKNYVDGSVPGGFQRTMIFGKGGELLLKSGKSIHMESLFLEEDAARRIKTEGKFSYFRLDRLGIPLVELTTAPEIYDPQEARDAAYRIGMLLRSTGKVKKILGSIRQDINISIKEGARIEVKGVQKLDWIPELCKYECMRQLALIDIRKKITDMKLNPDNIVNKPIDITDVLKETQCKFVNAGIKKGDVVLGLCVPGFKGIYGITVQPNRRFGTEIASKVKVLTGLKGLIHSDEDLLGKYNFSLLEIEAIKSKLGVNENDLFVIIMGPADFVKDAFKIVVDRTKYAFKGIPGETRQASEDGTHEFLRELHGGARLYPDTDSLAYIVKEKRIDDCKAQLTMYPWEMIDAYSIKFKLDKDLVETMIMDGYIKLFDKLVEIYPDNPMLAVTTLNDSVKALHREEKDIDNLTDDHFITIFKALKENQIGKEAIINILRAWTDTPTMKFDDAKVKAGIATFNMEDLDKILSDIIQKNLEMIKQRGKGATGPLMGDLMKAVGRGTVDGKILSSKLNQALDAAMGGGSKGSPKESPKKEEAKEPAKDAKKSSASKKIGGK